METQKLQQGSSREGLDQLIETLKLSELQKQYMRSRWLDQVSYMSRRSRETRGWYYRLRMTAIIGSVIVPIMLGLQQPNTQSSRFDSRWLTIGLSGIVAISTAVEEFFHFGDRWRHFRHTTEALKTQGWQFSQLGGVYSAYPTHEAAFQSFTTHVETLLQQENKLFVSEVVKEKAKEEGKSNASFLLKDDLGKVEKSPDSEKLN
jgi:Protein of unknown function (DUF4231)